MSIYYLSHFVQIRTLGVTLLCVSGFGPRWPQAVGWSCSHPQTRGCASKGAHLHGSQTDTHFCWKGSVVFMGHSSWILEYPCSRSVAQSCLTLCDPMDCRTPGFPVFHHLPEFAQTRAHCVSDSTQPPNPLLTPSPLAFNLCQHQWLFQWFGYLHQVAKVLELKFQHQSFQWIFRVDFL